MRYRITILALLGLAAASAASGQIRPWSGGGDRTIQRNWPDDGAKNPSAGQVNWDGNDAVGLQFREHGSPKSPVVPVSMLKISREALKEMQKSDKALKARDVRGSAEHLEKMVKLAPDLALAHNSLGTRYVVLREYDKALAEFQKAVALQPTYRLAVDNITVTLCVQHRYGEAEPAARQALQIEPEAASSKYLLGSILINEGKPTEEATKLLRSVQDKYPRARMFLAMSLEMHGETGQAAEELREYLKSPMASDNGVAQEWLSRLETRVSAQKAGNGPSHE